MWKTMNIIRLVWKQDVMGVCVSSIMFIEKKSCRILATTIILFKEEAVIS